jgi:hypothetical protein
MNTERDVVGLSKDTKKPSPSVIVVCILGAVVNSVDDGVREIVKLQEIGELIVPPVAQGGKGVVGQLTTLTPKV